MKCKEAVNLLSPYIDEVLDAKIKEDLENHLILCKNCSRELIEMNEMVLDLNKIPKLEAPPQIIMGVHEDMQSMGVNRFWEVLERFFKPWQVRLIPEIAVLVMVVTIGINIWRQYYQAGNIQPVLVRKTVEEKPEVQIPEKENIPQPKLTELAGSKTGSFSVDKRELFKFKLTLQKKEKTSAGIKNGAYYSYKYYVPSGGGGSSGKGHYYYRYSGGYSGSYYDSHDTKFYTHNYTDYDEEPLEEEGIIERLKMVLKEEGATDIKYSKKGILRFYIDRSRLPTTLANLEKIGWNSSYAAQSSLSKSDGKTDEVWAEAYIDTSHLKWNF